MGVPVSTRFTNSQRYSACAIYSAGCDTTLSAPLSWRSRRNGSRQPHIACVRRSFGVAIRADGGVKSTSFTATNFRRLYLLIQQILERSNDSCGFGVIRLKASLSAGCLNSIFPAATEAPVGLATSGFEKWPSYSWDDETRLGALRGLDKEIRAHADP